MDDRIAEIRARLDAAINGDDIGVAAVFLAHAPTDIAWLLDELETLRAQAIGKSGS